MSKYSNVSFSFVDLRWAQLYASLVFWFNPHYTLRSTKLYCAPAFRRLVSSEATLVRPPLCHWIWRHDSTHHHLWPGYELGPPSVSLDPFSASLTDNSLLCNGRNATRYISSCIPSVKTSNTDVSVGPSSISRASDNTWTNNIGGWMFHIAVAGTSFKWQDTSSHLVIAFPKSTPQLKSSQLYLPFPIAICVLCRTRMIRICKRMLNKKSTM